MNLTLSLSPEESADLQRRAAAVGTDVKTFVLQMLHDAGDSGELPGTDLPYDQWRTEFQLWVSRQRSRNANMDDSRESIYD